MGNVKQALWLLVLAAGGGGGPPAAFPQEKPAADEADRILLTDRTERRGEITGCDPSGILEVRDRETGRKGGLVVEQVRKIRFGRDEIVLADAKSERLYLSQGGTLSGRLLGYEGGVASIETPAGTFRVRRADIRSIFLGPLQGQFPEIKEERKDVLVQEAVKAGGDGKLEGQAAYGELLSIVKDRVVFRTAKEEVFGRAAVRRIFLHNERPAVSDLPPGWFSKILFRNGDRLAGVLRSVGKDRVGIFSHLVGEAEIEKRHIHSIAFLQHARMTVDNIIVCDQSGVREFDLQGREVWSYTANVHNAGSARRLENGNVLIASTNSNQVLEVEPSGKSGGKIVWRLDSLSYPLDAVRLENGNTLVAEQQAGRVVEYDARTKAAVWTCTAMNYPTSVQRLENGNTLICSFQGLVEVDREGRTRWTLGMGRIRPWKAQRLDNGNTLIADLQRNQVVEIDPQSKDVWHMENLQRPVQAIRLEDGSTLILEQGEGRVIEVDPSRRSRDRITGLNVPMGMSTY